MRWFILALIGVPALEIGVFIWAGGVIGPWWVVGLIILTGIMGISLARQQGLETWRRAQEAMQHGHPPGKHIIDGISIFVGGLLIFTPGFITDVIGLLLIIPVTRGIFSGMIIRFLRHKMEGSTFIIRRW